MAQSQPADNRPLSPHISIWRWHATMLSSILHRMTGAALYGGAILVTIWLVALATGPDAYASAEALMTSIFGQIILYGFALAALFHLANGIRHLIWDGPRAGFSPGVANLASWFSIIFAVLGTAAIWMLTHAGGS